MESWHSEEPTLDEGSGGGREAAGQGGGLDSSRGGGREEESSSSGTSGSRIEMHGDKMVLDTKLAERGKEPRNKGQEQEEHQGCEIWRYQGGNNK